MSLLTNQVSYWKLDESSGNAADSAGSNTLTNTNVTYTTGKINNGAVFNGSNAKLVMGSTAFGPSYSYSFWVYRNSSASNMSLISKDDGTTRVISLLSNSSGNIEGTVWLSTGSVGITPFAISNGVMNHIVITLEASVAVKIYLNNSEVESIPISYGALTTSFGTWFGADQFGGGRWFLDGKMDEIGYWSRALTSDERSELYNSGDGVQYPYALEIAAPLFSITNTFYAPTLSLTNPVSVYPPLFSVTNTFYAPSLQIGIWSNPTKNTANYTNLTKNTAPWTNPSKSNG